VISLNLVVLRSADLPRAADFYSKLGLEFTRHRHGKGPEHLAAELPGSVFEIYPLADGDPPTSGTRIGFSVKSVADAVAAIPPDHLISPPKDSEWGIRAVIKDPDGHRVELIE
jgi:catechol 2,3-dioxygenase-like lactoylglutathione lyase family enzyme